jgi:hypothetical protein
MNQIAIHRNEETLSIPQPFGWLWAKLMAGRLSREELTALAKPATELEIAQHLALLLKARPTAKAADGEIFGAKLIEDVAAMKPAVGDLIEACRHIRRTSKFLPTIAEVLDALVAVSEERVTLTRSISVPVKQTPAITHIRVASVQADDDNPLPL